MSKDNFTTMLDSSLTVNTIYDTTLTSPTVDIVDTLTIDGITGMETIDIDWGQKAQIDSLIQKVNAIEDRLSIFQVDPELESEWKELKEIGKQYRELEQSILKKKKVWNILKDE